MKTYLVIKEYPYEGIDVLAVCSTEAKAIEWMESYTNAYPSMNESRHLYIETFQLDPPLELPELV